MLNFKKIKIEDFNEYKRCTENNKEFSCENSFINLLVWQSAYDNMIAYCDSQVFIKSGKKGKEKFKLPLGGELAKGIEKITEYAGGFPSFWVQEGPLLEEFRTLYGDKYNFESFRDAADYIYLREDLAMLSGKKYHSKRNHINAFSKKYDWHYEKINNDNIEKIKLCAKEWYKENSDRLSSSMLCEKDGVFTVLSNVERLEAIGGAIFVGDRAVAFTVGSAVNGRVFDIHYEKALKDYSEAYTVINNQFAENELSEYELINREDDMGLEGLRKAKLSYNPHIILEKYSLRYKK